MAEERHIVVSRSVIPDFHAALAWAVQRYDQEFTDASMVKLIVEQTMISTGSNGWTSQWTASVAGLTEERPTPEETLNDSKGV